jgi:hypothetical protein
VDHFIWNRICRGGGTPWFKVVTQLPLNLVTPNNLPVIKNTVDQRDKYGQGLNGVMATIETYAGYIALRYEQPTVAYVYFKRALTIDPSDAQATDLITNLTEAEAALKVSPKVMSAQEYLKAANEAKDKGEATMEEDFVRKASYLEPTNLEILKRLEEIYTHKGNTARAEAIAGHIEVVMGIR